MQKIIFSLLMLASGTLVAQDYDLNNYKYRFQKYRYAQFNFNFRGNNNYNMQKVNFKDSSRYSNAKKTTVDENRIIFNTSLPFSYYRVINTEQLQHMQSFDAQIDFASNTRIRDKQQWLSTNINYRTNNRIYKGLQFTEFNLNVSGSNFNELNFFNNYNYYNESYTTQRSGNYQLSVGKGKGRLEYVTDAVTAMFLLKDLQKKAGIGTYTGEQIEHIAKGITKINNTRFIDFRYRLIDQLTLLDSTLKKNGIMPASLVPYFTTINDNWIYATRFQRYSGQRWSFNFINKGSADFRKQKYKHSDTIPFTSIINAGNNLYNGIEFNFNKSRQASLHVQKSFDISAGGGLNFNTTISKVLSPNGNPESKQKPDEMRYYVNMTYGYLYQPNTRTYLQFNLRWNTTMSDNLYGMRVGNPMNRQRQNVNTTLIPEINVFRFFSPRFYYNLSVYSNINAMHNNQSDITYTRKTMDFNFPLNVNMGFTYTFF